MNIENLGFFLGDILDFGTCNWHGDCQRSRSVRHPSSRRSEREPATTQAPIAIQVYCESPVRESPWFSRGIFMLAIGRKSRNPDVSVTPTPFIGFDHTIRSSPERLIGPIQYGLTFPPVTKKLLAGRGPAKGISMTKKEVQSDL